MKVHTSKYTFLFKVRNAGAIGAFDEYRVVEVSAESTARLIDVVCAAGDVLRARYPEVESGGIVKAARDGTLLRSSTYVDD